MTNLGQLAGLAKTYDDYAGTFLSFKSLLRARPDVTGPLRLDWSDSPRELANFRFLGRSCRFRFEMSFAAGSLEPLAVVAVETSDGAAWQVRSVVQFSRDGVFDFPADAGGKLQMNSAGDLGRIAANLFAAAVETHRADG